MRQFYQMSPIDNNIMSGVRGKKTPGKPGRFDPSEPLHMTTRRAAKTYPTNGSPSLNGSADDSASRRGSFDDLRPLTSHSNGSQVSAKSRRLSELSVTNVTPDNHINGIHSSEEKWSGQSISNAISPVQQTPSPSLKRKRSPSTPPQPLSVPQPNESTEFGNYESGPTFTNDPDDEDTVEVVRQEDLSDRERPASQQSFGSEDATQGDIVMAEASMAATPAESEPVSPVTSESRSQEDPLTKSVDAALEKISQAAVDDEPDDQDDIDDAIDVGEDIEAEEVDEVDEQADDDDGRPRRGRFGGRRRAKHPNPQVEKAMQRQADLKTAYRAIARAQKTILAEIAQRTISDLETNPQLHLQAQEYDHVKSGLDKAYARRQQQLQSQHEMNVEQIGRTLEGEQQMLRMICNERLAELKHEMLVQLEHKMLSIARDAQLAENEAGYETEDEDDVVPRPKRTGYKWSRSGAIEEAYDSRSRPAIETRRAIVDMEGRFDMHRMIKDLDEAEKEANEPGFTVMDSNHREMADYKRLSLRNTEVLAAAAAKVKMVIPNEEAKGLQTLADLASRPSIGMYLPQPRKPSKSRRESMVGQSPSRPVPPHLHLQTQYGPSSIPVEMSPRTTQAMGDRFDTIMPPPLTPRQGATSYIHSPDANRTGFPAISPTVHTPRMNGQTARRLSDSRPESRRSVFPTFNSPQNLLDRFPERRPDFGATPFRAEESRNEMPGWREYPSDHPPPSARRTSFNNERTSFTFSRGVIPGGERDRIFGPRSDERREESDEIKRETSAYNPAHRSSTQWPEPLSQPGAPDSRQQDPRSPPLDMPRLGWRPLNLAPRSPVHSRNNSLTFSVHDRRRDSESGDSQQKAKSLKGIFQLKSSKAERGGIPRRQWSKDQRKHSRSLDKPASASSPTLASSSFARSPVERAPQPAPWGGPQPPQHSPIGPPPPTAIYQPSPAPYGGQPPQYSPGQPGHDYYHRNSFPPPPQQSPASIWNQPQSHLYAVPHPPPPGVPPEQFSRFAAPPPPSFQPPPPHSAPVSYGHQFGGPPLAPATATPGFHLSGIRPSQPPPAFAQQAQQQQSTFGRQRARSDASNLPKFHAYHPPRR